MHGPKALVRIPFCRLEQIPGQDVSEVESHALLVSALVAVVLSACLTGWLCWGQGKSCWASLRVTLSLNHAVNCGLYGTIAYELGPGYATVFTPWGSRTLAATITSHFYSVAFLAAFSTQRRERLAIFVRDLWLTAKASAPVHDK